MLLINFLHDTIHVENLIVKFFVIPCGFLLFLAAFCHSLRRIENAQGQRCCTVDLVGGFLRTLSSRFGDGSYSNE